MATLRRRSTIKRSEDSTSPASHKTEGLDGLSFERAETTRSKHAARPFEHEHSQLNAQPEERIKASSRMTKLMSNKQILAIVILICACTILFLPRRLGDLAASTWAVATQLFDYLFRLDPTIPMLAIVGTSHAGIDAFLEAIGGRRHKIPRLFSEELIIYKGKLFNQQPLYLMEAPYLGFSMVGDQVDGVPTRYNTHVLDMITRELEYWKTHSHLIGILCLHDMSLNNTLGLDLKSFENFDRLCGPSSLSLVTLAVINGIDDPSTTEQIEDAARWAYLKDQYWWPMMLMGSQASELDGSNTMAGGLLLALLQKFEWEHSWRSTIDQERLSRKQKTIQKMIQNEREARGGIPSTYQSTAPPGKGRFWQAIRQLMARLFSSREKDHS